MNTSLSYCDGCGSVGESCCQNAKAQKEVATALAKLIYRQEEIIKELRRRLGETKTDVKTGESDYKWSCLCGPYGHKNSSECANAMKNCYGDKP